MRIIILGQGVILVLAMSLAWWFQLRWRNAGWVDVFWTFATGVAAIAGALWPLPEQDTYLPRQIVVALLAAVWSIRLGTHLRHRVLTRPEDVRYAGFRRDWGERFQSRLFWFLQIQAAAAWPLAISVGIAARNPKPGVTVFDCLALVVIAIAILGEATADRQLARFVHDPRNAGGVCGEGLWAWSRHPNYFFEFVGWCAWPLFALDLTWSWFWLSLPAPVLMYWLLVHVSGIPPLEQAMLASRGDAWRAYQSRTSAFFPLPPRREANA